MNKLLYDKIVEIINKNQKLSRHELFDLINEPKFSQANGLLSLKYNLDSINSNEIIVKNETFTSIYSNIKRKKMFKSSASNSINWRRLKENSLSLCAKYKEYEAEDYGGEGPKRNIILKIAIELNVAPVLVCRLLLEGFIKMGCLELNTEFTNGASFVSAPNTPQTNTHAKISVSQLIKETHMLKNPRLAAEVLECCAIDDDYGPTIDLIKNLIGIEYEQKLETILKHHGITFTKEDELREKGFDKTPDFKLELPIYLNNGMCISWIDSKATFGDEQSHADYYENQFKYYLNRFGSGLVIYWFGYLSDIEKINFSLFRNQANTTAATTASSITISHTFPTDFTMLNIKSLLN